MSKQTEINTIISDAKFLDQDIPAPIPVITIQNKNIATCSNFITLNGLPKSRKTTFMSFFIYSALSGSAYFDIKVNINHNDKIIIIDTEQSIYDFSRQISNLKRMLNVKKMPVNFDAYLFRKYEPNVILNSIYTIMQDHKPKILFIDNLTELVVNVNDINESKAVVQFLKKITFEFNCVVVCLLHLGKGNLQTLGNLGSMADRAAQSVLRVVYDAGSQGSTLEPVMLRSDAHFNPITIFYDQDAKTYQQTESIKKESKKFVLDNVTHQDHINRLNVIFLDASELIYSELVESIKQVYGVGTNIAKQQIIPYLVGNKYLTKKAGIYSIKTNKNK